MSDQQLTNTVVRRPLPPGLIHDLRTPLNQIIGYTEMLIERAEDLDQPEFVSDQQKVLLAGRRLLEIIEHNFDSTPDPVSPTLDLPARNAEIQQPTRARFENVSPRAGRGSTENPAAGVILVVDDDAGNREVLSRRLEMQGYVVATARNGREALTMLEAQPYDLVLLDIMMPEVDGYEVLRRLKDSELLQHVPVIMISAMSDLESVARCIELGAEDYLPKPFNPTLLKARIGACLEKKHAHDREQRLFEQLESNYEKLQSLEKLRDDLTHMIVHDLRTPLTSVMAAIQSLDVVGDVNEGQREMMDIAVSSSDSLLVMINGLLDVDKFESGAMELEYTLLSLPELIAFAISQVIALAHSKNITVTQQISTDLPWLNADESKLQRVLVNLLGNALKFTPGGGTVTLSAYETPDRASVEFCVQDTGEGIPAEAFGRIFEKFGQVESRHAGRTMSTGLGLTFCKLAVEAHGGHIGVESAQGEGAKFCFTIPLRSGKA